MCRRPAESADQMRCRLGGFRKFVRYKPPTGRSDGDGSQQPLLRELIPANVKRSDNVGSRGILAQTPQGAERERPRGLSRNLKSFGCSVCNRRIAKRTGTGSRARGVGKNGGFVVFRKRHRK
jgi:hypothetical protein